MQQQKAILTFIGVLTGAICTTTPLAVASGERISGERVDQSTYGTGVTETLDDALAREASAPAQWLLDRHTRNGVAGSWIVPGRRATTSPKSGEHHAMNKWGDTEMGIRFPELVDVHGAYFAGQGGRGSWTTGVRVTGYLNGEATQQTEWFRNIGEEPAWFEMDLCGVNRIVIEAEPVVDGAGWYALDDLTFTRIAEAEQGPTVLDFEDVTYSTSLTGSRYYGLVWETGTGDFGPEQAIHAPKLPPGTEPERPQATTGGVAMALQDGGTAPTLVRDFEGVKRGDSGSSSYPPDTHGAIGPNHFVETINRVFAVYNKTTGALITSMYLGSFLPGSNGDPRVLFDQHSGRWIVIVSDFTERIYIAVSLTDDPTGSWYKSSFIAETGKWPDYPTLGVDAHGIYVGAYMVGGSYLMTLFAIDKDPLIGASPYLGTVTAFRNLPHDGALQPAQTFGTPAGEYVVSTRSSTSLRIRRIDASTNPATITDVGNVSVPSFGSPPDAPALGSSTNLDTVGDRLMNAVYRDGSLWTCHTINYSGRAACRWYEIDPVSVTLIQSGTVSSGSLHYFFPSIMVNTHGDVAMGFTGSSSSQYAGAYFTGRRASDSLGEMAAPVQYRAGTGPQNNIDSYGRNRWGDYSYTSLDPDNESDFWTIQEYGHSVNKWGTQIAVLRVGDCNGNGILDADDIAGGTSLDVNGNGLPDECEVSAPELTEFTGTNRYVAIGTGTQDVQRCFSG